MYKQMAGAIVLSCVCVTAMAGYGFEPIAALAPEDAGTRAVAVGDVTRDGRDDVILLAAGSHPFYRNRVILYAQTPGGFAPPVAIDYHPDPTAYDAAASGIGLADLDADADLDIVVSHGSYPFASLTVLRNDADGFIANTFPSDESLSAIKFMDVDGDGNLDLVGQGYYVGIGIFLGNGAAGFGEATWLPNNTFQSTFHLVDIDGDSRKDIVYKYSEEVYAHRHDGAGFSATPRTLLTLGDAGYSAQLAVEDFDGDDRADLAIAFDSWLTRSIFLYPQGSDGKFRRKQLAGRVEYVSDLRAGDLDSDGRQDLLMLDQFYSRQFGVMFGRARGFAPKTSYAAGRASGFTLGDINNDGMKDVLLLGGNGSVSYILGRSSATEPDLAVFLGLNAGAAVVRVENRGGFSVGGYEITLRLDPRLGSASPWAPPDGCSAYNNWDGSLGAYCQMPALAPGAHHERTFPFDITAPTQRNLLFGRAQAHQSGPELRLDNNVAAKRINIVTPAD